MMGTKKSIKLKAVPGQGTSRTTQGTPKDKISSLLENQTNRVVPESHSGTDPDAKGVVRVAQNS